MHDNLKQESAKAQRSVVITGGTKGIGLAITQAFVNAGYFVVVGAREKSSLGKILSNNVVFESVDVRDEKAHLKLTELAFNQTGAINVYINNAGFSAWRSLDKIDSEFIDNVLDTNLKGAIWGCKAASQYMSEGGSIINISSIAGKRGSANNTVYAASKFALNGVTQSLAKELGSRQIRVNSLCPVLVSTDGLMSALSGVDAPGKDDPSGFITQFAQTNSALRRLPTSDEVARMCLVLASEQSSAITGQCINIDCGVFPQ